MKQHGMALMEVLVAMLILAVSATAVLKTSGQQANYLSSLQQKQMGTWLADSKLAEILLNPASSNALWQQENQVMGPGIWHLRWRTVPTTQLAIVAVEVEVRQGTIQQPVASLRTWMSLTNGQA
ncbi:hypothetical protein NG99_09610 [Erwinia typographi]|uniref:Type II secretion system protein I n=1 Tax=Erwinia typographi TaxID=371042 RepID=A0A0A4A9A0_9GAMM|nr:type II secretion system minor pseudopilin GspI [Erwinia typographi]KGT94398.1 hypothetical protein NG99_09610 [Erwinia typographi]